MGITKKVDLTIEELKDIALAINKNTVANKNIIKEDKISSDKFIKQFGINRKDFSETIKDTCIKYNKSKVLYTTDNSQMSFFNTEVYKSSDKVNLPKPLVKQEVHKETTVSSSKEIQSIPKDTLQLPQEFSELLALTGELKEMVDLYKKQTNTNIIDIPDININNSKLDGEIITRSFKMYKEIADEFSKFAEDRKEKQKDLISLAILEFIDKYKR
ncbi:hypothetical protein [Clostridium sp.]|uniref:hypothetical protein n=1 Tax=Clostridium sp. TaxID=1506 RepID=UPI003D6D6A5D